MDIFQKKVVVQLPNGTYVQTTGQKTESGEEFYGIILDRNFIPAHDNPFTFSVEGVTYLGEIPDIKNFPEHPHLLVRGQLLPSNSPHRVFVPDPNGPYWVGYDPLSVSTGEEETVAVITISTDNGKFPEA